MKEIEVKALNKDLGLKRAIKILEINEKAYTFEVIEKIKPRKKLFGLLGTEMGLYLIKAHEKDEKKENKKDKVNKTQKIEKDLNKEKSIQKEEKIKINESKANNFSVEINEKANLILKLMNLDLKSEVKKEKDNLYIVNLIGKDNAIIIGKKGKTLNSFEYLLNTFFKNIKIEIDVEGFKEKRNETLRELAKKMSVKVIKTGKIVKLNPMPPRERKIIHEIVNKFPELDTYSEGRDPKRYIVIKKKNKK